MPEFHLEFKWTVSRGRDTYGYNICTLYANGQRVGRCNGGGYDMVGTAFAEWLSAAYQDRLMSIKERAYYKRTCNTGIVSSEENPAENRLYGMFLIDDIKRRKTLIMLDGACGMSSMERIAAAIGITLKYIPSKSKNNTHYLATVSEDIQ